MKPIIEINNLSKKYVFGLRKPDNSLRDTISRIIKSPFTKIRHKATDKSLREDEFWALKDISFNVMKGEVIGIIGRNGAGKSTLLKILSRITPPTNGDITLRGRVASLLEVGTGFHSELTGRENIYLNGAILGMKRVEIKDKFDEIVEFAEISKFLDTPVKHYSSGMYMRLAFAIAAHLEPEILIVDEVLAVGDLNFRKKSLGKMKEVSAKSGRTVLFVSHDMGAIKSLSNKTIFLEKGAIFYSGTTGTAIKKYLETTFYGSIKANGLEWKSDNKVFPYDDIIKIKQFSIQDDRGKTVKGKLFNSKKYFAMIKADIVSPNPSLIIAVFFYDEEHNLLFSSDMCDTGEISFDKIKPGKICLSIPIPVEFLANRIYRVEVTCCLQNIGWIIPPNNETRLSLEVFRDKDLNPYFNSAENGLIAPVLKWKLSI